MKHKKIKLSIAVLIIICICLFFLFALKEHFYHSAYSIAKTNSRTVAFVLDKLSNNNEISFENETVIEGYFSKDKIVIAKIDGVNFDKSYSGVVAEMEANLYWKAVFTQNEIVAWSCSKDILDDSNCKEYEYGDQNNVKAIFNKELIGYYCLTRAE